MPGTNAWKDFIRPLRILKRPNTYSAGSIDRNAAACRHTLGRSLITSRRAGFTPQMALPLPLSDVPHLVPEISSSSSIQK